MKNVVLVRLGSRTNPVITPPLGIGYLLKVLENINGVSPVFIDAHRDRISRNRLLEKIKALSPHIVGFQVFSIDYAAFRRLMPQIRAICPKSKIIAGGPHISGLPEQTLIENPDLDFVVKGEGEEALDLLVRGLSDGSLSRTIEDIPNLGYRSGGRVVVNKGAFVDVNKYGAPNWKLLEPDKYPAIQHGTFHKADRVVPILTSRGCPYPCTFCAGHLVTGKKIRRRDVKNIVDEIEFLQSTYGFEEIIIEDENFTFYKEHVIELSNELKNRKVKCHVSFPSGIRLDRIDDEIVHHLRRMGTYMVTLGIESGSQKTLKAMKKSWNLQEVKDKVRLLRKNRIVILACFIVGFCDETLEDIEMTMDFAIKSGVDTAFFGNYIPLPGSEDFNRMVAKKELELEKINWDTYTSCFDKFPYCPPGMSEKDLRKAIQWGTFRFYCRPRIILGLLKRMTRPIFLKSFVSRAIDVFRQNSEVY